MTKKEQLLDAILRYQGNPQAETANEIIGLCKPVMDAIFYICEKYEQVHVFEPNYDPRFEISGVRGCNNVIVVFHHNGGPVSFPTRLIEIDMVQLEAELKLAKIAFPKEQIKIHKTVIQEHKKIIQELQEEVNQNAN